MAADATRGPSDDITTIYRYQPGGKDVPSFFPTSIPKATRGRYNRVITPDGKEYPGVMEILKGTRPPGANAGLEAWRKSVGDVEANRIMKRSTEAGNATHRLIECHLRGEKAADDIPLAAAHFQNLKPYLNDIDQIHGLELPLYSDRLEVAGVADCIAEYRGVLSCVDFKTKRTPQKVEWIHDYRLQAAAYAIMYEELSGIPVRQSVILVSSEKKTRQEFIGNVAKHTDEFLARTALYHSRK